MGAFFSVAVQKDPRPLASTLEAEEQRISEYAEGGSRRGAPREEERDVVRAALLSARLLQSVCPPAGQRRVLVRPKRETGAALGSLIGEKDSL